MIMSRFDAEREGKIDVSEMKFVLKNLPVRLTDDEVEAMLTAADENQQGEINIQQFRTMIGLSWNLLTLSYSLTYSYLLSYSPNSICFDFIPNK